ncbi:MAG TPA: low molecular weight protein-tyrosine-phosphatase [Cellvibrionaceae bacterium]
MVKVLFVCLGNICRSPTAEGVFAHKLERLGLTDEISIDSAGTGHWHVGKAPDGRAIAAAAGRGYRLEQLRARQAVAGDFALFDYILAMDSDNLAHLQALKPAGFTGHLGLFLEFAGQGAPTSVPDPYYGGDDGFQQVLDLIEAAADGLLVHIQQQQLAQR